MSDDQHGPYALNFEPERDYDAMIRDWAVRLEERYRQYRVDTARLMMGLPALYSRFTGPTPRKHYSRRERRRRRWL